MIQCPTCRKVIGEVEAEHCPFCGASLSTDVLSPFRPSPSYTNEPAFSLVMAVQNGVPSGQTVLDVTEQKQIIGRSEQADFKVNLPSVSRRHAAVWAEGGLVLITDLGSQHGTYVNSREVASEPLPLRPGDRISLSGEVNFHVVVQEEDDEGATNPREAGDEIPLPPARPVSTDLPRPELAPPQAKAADERQHLNVLSALCSATVKVASEEELFTIVVEHLAQRLPADRFFAMVGRALETLGVAAALGELDPPPSRGILRRVLYSLSDRPFVTCDAQAEKGIANRTSIMMSNVRSVMCVGLVVNGVCEGMIYVDTLGTDQPFSRDDEDFLHVVGQITGARLAMLRSREELDALEEELKLRGGGGPGGGGLEPVELS